MSDKYELFLDRDKKVKIAADEEGNFFAEANGNRVKLGDSGLQKFGEGGVLEDVVDISAAVGETKTFSFWNGFSAAFITRANQYLPGANASSSFSSMGAIPGFTEALDETYNYITSFPKGTEFDMQVEFVLDLNIGWSEAVVDDWDQYYNGLYPGYYKKNSSLTRSSSAYRVRNGNIAKTRYGNALDAGLTPDPTMATSFVDIYGPFYYDKGASDYGPGEEYPYSYASTFTTNNTDQGYFEADPYNRFDKALFGGIEVLEFYQNSSTQYKTIASNVGITYINSNRIAPTNKAAYYSSLNDFKANLFDIQGPLHDLRTTYYQGPGFTQWLKYVNYDNKNIIKGYINIKAI